MERLLFMASLHPRIPFCPPAKPPVSAQFAELLKPLPRPSRSYEDWFVHTHKDLAQMTPKQLQAEVVAVEQRIAYEAPHVPMWLFARLARVRALLLVATEGATR